MNYRVLQLLGIAFTAFLIGIAITDPLVSAAVTLPKLTDKPPPFQVLAANFDQAGGSWIGGVAGYDTVTIILSDNYICVSEPCPAHRDYYVYVFFQKGSAITEATPPYFTWSSDRMAQPYAVPRGAETIIIVTAVPPSVVYSLAISLK